MLKCCMHNWLPSMLQITAFIKPFTSNQNMDVFVNTTCSSQDHSISGLTAALQDHCRQPWHCSQIKLMEDSSHFADVSSFISACCHCQEEELGMAIKQTRNIMAGKSGFYRIQRDIYNDNTSKRLNVTRHGSHGRQYCWAPCYVESHNGWECWGMALKTLWPGHSVYTLFRMQLGTGDR